jgi:hypothetical protein
VDRRTQRVQVRHPREICVDRLQQPCCRQHQRRGLAHSTRGKRDQGPHEIGAGALEIAERPGFRHGQQFQRRPGRASLDLGLRRGQRPRGPPGRIGRQRRGPLQERCCRGHPAAGLCPAGRALQLSGNLLVRTGSGLGPVPGAAVGIVLRIGDLGQGAVRLPPLPSRRKLVGRRAGQGMPEPDPGAEFRQAGLGNRRRRLHADTEARGCPPDQGRVAGRVGRGEQQQPARLVRQGCDSPPEILLDAALDRHCAWETEAAG